MESRADALFALCDGLLSAPHAHSPSELSLSPSFGRKWPSVYAALADGKLDIDRLWALCVQYVLAEALLGEIVWVYFCLNVNSLFVS